MRRLLMPQQLEETEQVSCSAFSSLLSIHCSQQSCLTL